MKGGSVAGLPVECRCPPSVCWCPPCRLPCGPVDWREWYVLCVAPCSDWVWRLALCRPPFTLSVPFVLFSFLFCLVLLCLLWVGKCGGGTVPRFPLLLPTVCVLCHGIVGLGLCFCDRVVSLWNSGDGLCWGEGVWYLLSTYHPCVVCVSVWCVFQCGVRVVLL